MEFIINNSLPDGDCLDKDAIITIKNPLPVVMHYPARKKEVIALMNVERNSDGDLIGKIVEHRFGVAGVILEREGNKITKFKLHSVSICL